MTSEPSSRGRRDPLLWAAGALAWCIVGWTLGVAVLALGGGQQSHERTIVRPPLPPVAAAELLRY